MAVAGRVAAMRLCRPRAGKPSPTARTTAANSPTAPKPASVPRGRGRACTAPRTPAKTPSASPTCPRRPRSATPRASTCTVRCTAPAGTPTAVVWYTGSATPSTASTAATTTASSATTATSRAPPGSKSAAAIVAGVVVVLRCCRMLSVATARTTSARTRRGRVSRSGSTIASGVPGTFAGTIAIIARTRATRTNKGFVLTMYGASPKGAIIRYLLTRGCVVNFAKTVSLLNFCLSLPLRLLEWDGNGRLPSLSGALICRHAFLRYLPNATKH